MTYSNDSKSYMVHQNHLGSLISGHLPRPSDLLRELFWPKSGGESNGGSDLETSDLLGTQLPAYTRF